MGLIFKILGGGTICFGAHRSCCSLASPINGDQDHVTRKLNRILLCFAFNRECHSIWQVDSPDKTSASAVRKYSDSLSPCHVDCRIFIRHKECLEAQPPIRQSVTAAPIAHKISRIRRGWQPRGLASLFLNSSFHFSPLVAIT